MNISRSEGFVLTGYVVLGCVDGAWMLWGYSYAVAVAVAVLAHPGWGGRGSLRERSPLKILGGGLGGRSPQTQHASTDMGLP